MLRDELELITGRLIPTEAVTRTVFNMLRPSEVFDQISEDVKSRRREVYADTPDPAPTASENFGGGFDILRWLSEEGESVTV